MHAQAYRTLSASDIASELYEDSYASWHQNYDACLALAEYLEQCAEDMGEAVIIDRVAIRCDFSLMENIKEFNEQYNTEYESHDEITETTVIDVDGESFIIQDF